MMSISGKAKQNAKWNCTKKLKKSSSPPFALSLLPDDIILNCLASASRSDYASLSLVSKSYRSLLLSPKLYEVRSELGCTENCIFVCLSISSDPFARWFAFYPKALNSPGRLVPIRPHLYQPPEESSVVAHGYGIYVIGGVIGGNLSSRVFYLDCRFHTWINLPSMGVGRASAAVGVVDGKIYVLGGCEEPKSHRWGEVFDPKTQTWDVLPKPPVQYHSPVIQESAVVEEKKVFALNKSGEGLLYIPSEGIWKIGNSDTNRARSGWHVIENVVYCCVTGGRILWCEASELKWPGVVGLKWREVMGLEHLRNTLSASKLVNYGLGKPYRSEYPSERLDNLRPGHKLSNSGPNMLLFWDVFASEKLKICCAEISLQRRKETGEIWGNVEWYAVVRTLDRHEHQCTMTDPYEERRNMKRLKEYIDRRGFVALAEYGIPTSCPCGAGIMTELAPAEARDNLPGKRFFTCKEYKDDGLHFRQPWVCGVEEEFRKLNTEIEKLRDLVEMLTRRVTELEKISSGNYPGL